MRLTTLLFILCMHLSLYGQPFWTVCIEGGGSKTILQMLDEHGNVLSLTKDGSTYEQLVSTGSNINSVGMEGVQQVLTSLIEDTAYEGVELTNLLSQSQLVAGMAGIGNPQNKQDVQSIFESFGIAKNAITLLTDAEIALNLVGEKGMILIAGTGSICLGKCNQRTYQTGGLGRILGDEGSGYQIGLQAIKAGIEEEYGWGMPTSLSSPLSEFYETNSLIHLVRTINSGIMTPAKIASATPLVFEKAWEGDPVANTIIDKAAKDLSALIITMTQIAELTDCEVHLWGGLFKNEYAYAFIDKIFSTYPIRKKNLIVVNCSNQNAATLYAQKMIQSRND